MIQPPAATHPRAALRPDDAADARLVSQVHPPGWVNPRATGRYHLVVVGAGTAGLVSTIIGAGLGARVAIVERGYMGGDCLVTGCVPSKALVRAARAWHEARRAAADFGGPAAAGDGDFAAVMARVRALRADVAHADAAERYRGLGADVFFGDAVFTGPDTVAVDGQTLRFRRAIVATGGRPALPDVPGLDAIGALTSDSVWSLARRPAHLLVIGGGPIGCELAQAFARLGARVTLLESGPRLLPRDDADAAAIVTRALAADGVDVRCAVRLTGARRDGDTRTLAFTRAGTAGEVAGDAVLVAAGRRPNVEGLGLDAAGVRHDGRGIVVNDRLRTANARIFAVGDCASPWHFTHAADALARLAVPNALFHGLGGGRASRLVIPWCTYTSPEVAHVGIGEADAAARDDVETLTLPLASTDRAVLDGDEGYLRLFLRRSSDRILGGTLVAADAGNMIGDLALAMVHGLGLAQLGAAIRPYPTQSEIFRRASDAHRRTRLTPRARVVLALALRLLR